MDLLGIFEFGAARANHSDFRNVQGRFGLISTNTRAHMSYCLFFNPLLKVLVLAGLMAKPYDLQNVFFKKSVETIHPDIETRWWPIIG